MRASPIRRRSRIERGPHEEFCVECDRQTPHLGRMCLVCRKRHPKASKLGNVPTVSVTGARRQSRKEAEAENTLVALQNAGKISDLRAQVRYRLAPYRCDAVDALLEAVDESASAGKLQSLATIVRNSRVHVCDYIADFAFQDGGSLRVVDPKGRRQGDQWQRFVQKQRLMKICHGIEVEVW